MNSLHVLLYPNPLSSLSPFLFAFSSLGDIRDGHQYVSVGANHVCVGMVTNDPPDGPHPAGDGAAECQLQHQHRLPHSTGRLVGLLAG